MADMGVLDPSRIDSQPDQSIRLREAIKTKPDVIEEEDEESDSGSDNYAEESQPDIKELELLPMPAEREMNGPELAEEELAGSASISESVSEIRRNTSQEGIEEIEA